MRKIPSMKITRLLRIICSEPLNYRILRIHGSHRFLVSSNYPSFVLSTHHGREVPSNKVKSILINEIGLSEEEAWKLIH